MVVDCGLLCVVNRLLGPSELFLKTGVVGGALLNVDGDVVLVGLRVVAVTAGPSDVTVDVSSSMPGPPQLMTHSSIVAKLFSLPG